VVIIFVASIIIFYWGIKEHTLRRIERFRWIAAQITGVSIESIEYAGGLFKIHVQRRPLDKKFEPVTISFSPLSWFFSDTVKIRRWHPELNKYITYSSVTINDKGDVWLEKKGEQIHGKMSGEQLTWDEPWGVRKVPGHHIAIEDGKLGIIDE
jgi:hypothetical protein